MALTVLVGQTIPTSGQVPFVVCDAAGRIITLGSADEETAELQAPAGGYVFGGVADKSTQYIANVTTAPEAVDRPAHGLSVEFLTSGVDHGYPGTNGTVFVRYADNASTLEVTDPEGNVYTFIADGTDQNGNPDSTTSYKIRLDMAGEHKVRVESFPKLDFEATFQSRF